jgi:hypothetical protein
VTLQLSKITPELRAFRASHNVAKVRFELFLFPPQAGLDWHLDTLLRHPLSREYLGNVLKCVGIKRAIAPAVGGASAIIRKDTFFSNVIPLTEGITLHNKPSEPADGTNLPLVGDAMIMAMAGCEFLAAISGRTLIAAHGAVKSFFDWEEIVTNLPSRKHRSVIEAMIDMVGNGPDSEDHSTLLSFLGIKKQDLRYDFSNNESFRRLPEYFEQNGYASAMSHTDEAVFIDLKAASKIQAKRAGFRKSAHYYDLPNNDLFANTRHEDDYLRNSRNLGVLVRRG